MSRIASVFFALKPGQRLVLALALIAVAAAVIGLFQALTRPSMTTLYSGLDAAAAGEVAAAVEAQGVPVEAQGASILVPAAERDRLRLALAAQGLPRNGPAGYELLEGLDGFGTTSEMFEATYWRAKEGELARTILAAPGVREARVHIANPVSRPFARDARPTASVTVTSSFGPLSAELAEAIRFMVGSAVAGLAPQAVSVIDAANGAVLRAGESAEAGGGRLPGAAREAKLRAEVERLLAARVGQGKAIVTVAVETSTESETVVERRIDPDSRVAISTDARSVEETAEGAPGGGATVASNLPQAAAAGGGDKSRRAETEERVNYEVSETTRERVRRPGDVRRVTVAVLVDGVVAPGEDGEPAWSPRSETELEQLRELVRSAVGYDAERGDVVTVETLRFADAPEEGGVARAGVWRLFDRHFSTVLQVGALLAVALGLILFVLRPLMRAGGAATPMLAGEAAPQLNFAMDDEDEEDEPAGMLETLRAAFADKKEDSASVLRSWLEGDVPDEDEIRAEKKP